MFMSAKGKQQKQARQLHCQEQSIDHIPCILPFGIVSRTFFPTTSLEIHLCTTFGYFEIPDNSNQT